MAKVTIENPGKKAMDVITAAYNGTYIDGSDRNLALLWIRVRNISDDYFAAKISKETATTRKNAVIAEYIANVERDTIAVENAALIEKYETAAMLYEKCLNHSMGVLKAYEAEHPRPDINDDHVTAAWYDAREHWIHETSMRVSADVAAAEKIKAETVPKPRRRGPDPVPEYYEMTPIENGNIQ